jgi:hypothetical protein
MEQQVNEMKKFSTVVFSIPLAQQTGMGQFVREMSKRTPTTDNEELISIATKLTTQWKKVYTDTSSKSVDRATLDSLGKLALDSVTIERWRDLYYYCVREEEALLESSIHRMKERTLANKDAIASKHRLISISSSDISTSSLVKALSSKRKTNEGHWSDSTPPSTSSDSGKKVKSIRSLYANRR